MSKKQEMNKTFPVSSTHVNLRCLSSLSSSLPPHPSSVPRPSGSTAEPQGREFYKVHDAHHTYLFTHPVFLFLMMRHVSQLCWN